MDLSILNPEQREAVTAPLGPVLVLAGAGSGKTRVLVYRIAYLIEQKLIKPEHVLALTFTNKAAKEMAGRVANLLKTKTGQPTLGTFHSVFARVLRREISRLGYTPAFTIYDTEDQRKVIRDVCHELDIDKKFQPSLFGAYISAAKNQMQTPQSFNIGLSGFMHDAVARVYAAYQNSLFKQNAVDFDDLLLLPIKLFDAVPEIKEKYRKIFHYILVDEYQDTNVAQYYLLSQLVTDGNLFVVGDDAQSIYKFRGSTIANILNFERDYEDAKVITLEQNYRSTKHILHAADSVIALNPNQKSKKLWTDNPSGDKVTVHESEDEYHEARFVAEKIIAFATGKTSDDEDTDLGQPEEKSFSILDHFLKKSSGVLRASSGHVKTLPAKHGPLTDFAVLYRTHAQSRALEEVFVRAGIPYTIIGGVRFYERKEIKDLLAYVRLLKNPFDAVSFKRVINEPARGLGEKSVALIQGCVEKLREQEAQNFFPVLLDSLPFAGLSAKQLRGAQDFFKIFDTVWNIDPQTSLTDVMRYLLKASRLEELYGDSTDAGQARKENMEELINVAGKFSNLSWGEASILLLEEVALVTEADNQPGNKDSVTLMTLHSAKGLEFDTVFFVGLEEGILPHSRSLLDPEELAEEIRLAYVGMTRAQKKLYLIYAKSRTLYGGFKVGVPSRILKALPEKSIKLPRQSSYSSTNLSDGSISYEEIDF